MSFLTYFFSEDPDPIYICQLTDLCPVVNNGSVTIIKTAVSPAKGTTGTTFTIGMIYNVTSPTGPGLLSIVIAPEVFL